MKSLILLLSLVSQTQFGFETPQLGYGKFSYRTTGSIWIFNGSSGISANGSGFTSQNATAPEGNQVGILQGIGSLTQSIPAWVAGTYQVSFQAAQRNYNNSIQTINISIDNQVIGSVTPSTITYQTYYTPPFNIVAGDHTISFQGINNTGDYTAFIDNIVIKNSNNIITKANVLDAWIGTSGKVFGVRFQTTDNTQVPLPIQSIQPPTLYRNGIALNPLGIPADLANNEVILYPLNDVIASNDIITATAPIGWVNTSSGLCSGLTNTIVSNRVGRSPLPSLTFNNRVIPGVNCNLGATSSWGQYWPFKNWAYKVGWPPQNLGRIQGNGTFIVYSNAGYNGIDQTGYPGPDGLWMVYWKGNAKFALSTSDPNNTSVTEQLDLNNPSAPNGYQGRVFNFQHQPNAINSNIDIQLIVTNNIAYDDLWIVGPGDFDIIPGTPVTFDTSDPFTLSRTFTQWIPPGVGSLRWVDSSNCGGNPVSCPYPELLLRATDKNWGDLAFRTIKFGYTSIGPVDPVATPWMYSPKFKETFPATLTDNITTTPVVGTIEKYVFSDAATAPLMAGLEITIDTEIMRIISVNNNLVSLYRGSNGTTPATHNAGIVQVSGRKALSAIIPANGIIPNGYTYQVTTATPHGITTGNTFISYGTWPRITWDDGEVTSRLDSRYPLITGPNTIVSFIGPTAKPSGTKPTQSYQLDPTKAYSEVRYGFGIPVEVTAITTAKFTKAALHVNINLDSSDDLVWTLLRLVHDNFPRIIIVEYMNEPWNWGFGGFEYITRSAETFGISNPYTLSYYMQRAGEIGNIGRKIFADRPNDFKLMLNCQLGSDQAKSHLAYAAKNNWQVDRIGIAPYLNIDTANKAFATWDNDQLCDLWIAFLWNNRANSGMAFNAYANQATGIINDYNKLTNLNCRLMGYEGGIESAVPPGTSYPLQRGLDLTYNPNWYWVEDAFYKWQDRWNFSDFYVYSLSQYHSPQLWGMYHFSRQKPGYGLNNRLRLAVPNRPNTKPANVNVDLNESVRGQAFIDRLYNPN